MAADRTPEPGIVRSTKAYDWWLLALEPAFAHDLPKKLEVMAGDPADFLRATFYRWSERFSRLCQAAAAALAVRAVGDVHVGNFGTWHDGEGRLRWGLNDFDEASSMPFPNDLVRLATSALLVRGDLGPEVVERAILAGYSAGVASGEFAALDVTEDPELVSAVAAEQVGRKKYFKKLAGKDELDADDAALLARLCDRLEELVPDGELHHRRAGRGSLGRVRIFALARSDPPVALEAKRVLRSAWSWAGRGGPINPDAADDRNEDQLTLLTDTRRRPDPETRIEEIDGHQWVLRPLSPDRVGVDFGAVDTITADLATKLLAHMGAEVAHVHLLSQPSEFLGAALVDLAPGWLAEAAAAMKDDTEADFQAWKRYSGSADAHGGHGHHTDGDEDIGG